MYWAIFILALDQLVKYIVLKTAEQVVLKNPGFVFGWSAGFPGLLIAIIILILSYLLYSHRFSNFMAANSTSFALIIAGGLSNLIDRIFRGYIVDYIHIGSWPVFNIADIAIVFGAVVLIFKIIRTRI